MSEKKTKRPSLFDNKTLLNHWKVAAENGGTRADVCRAIILEKGGDPDAVVGQNKGGDVTEQERVYQAVTQRIKALRELFAKQNINVVIPELSAGARGRKTSVAEATELAAIFG